MLILGMTKTHWLPSNSQTIKLQTKSLTSSTFRYATEYRNQIQTNHVHEFEKINENFEQYILRLARSMLVRVNSKYLAGATIRDPHRITAHFNNQPYHTAPLSLSLVHNAVIRAHLGIDHSITVFNKPLEYSTESRIKLLQLGGTMGFQLAVNVGFAMAFVASFYVLSYIKVTSFCIHSTNTYFKFEMHSLYRSGPLNRNFFNLLVVQMC